LYILFKKFKNYLKHFLYQTKKGNIKKKYYFNVFINYYFKKERKDLLIIKKYINEKIVEVCTNKKI
jgi:hypothetical protein